MAYELLVAMHVVDEEIYGRYRAAMTPILEGLGGGFRCDFVVSAALKSAASHPVNRVFAIFFPDKKAKEAFYANPDYVRIKKLYWEPSVAGRTILAEYER
jgi:uncharacterized protein (DUF1330 family)